MAELQTPQEAARTLDRLHRTLEATRLLNSTLDLTELTRIILRIVRDEVHVDRGTVFVVDRDGKQLRSMVAQDVDTEIVVPMGVGIAGTVAATGLVIDIPDAYADSRFDSSFDTVLGYRTNDIYCMPVINRDRKTVGVLELMNRRDALTDDDTGFLEAISVHIGIALENARLHQEIIEKKKIEQELALAKQIQETFLPQLPESYGGVELAGDHQMCTAVGGDYFSFFPLKDDRFLVMLGDVSGKGIGAALVMSSLHATCRALIRQSHELEWMSTILNEMLLETTRGRTFATLVICLVEPRQQQIQMIRAGHNPPLVVTSSGEIRLLEAGGGPPIGLFGQVAYEREVLTVQPGDVWVLYTDGISEAERLEGEQFGMERLGEVVRLGRSGSAAEVHSLVRRAVSDFVGEAPRQDDSTLMVLKF